MKLKISGGVGKKELLEAFSRMLNSLEDIGVNEFKGVNLYFNPYINGQKVIPVLKGDLEVSGGIVDFVVKSTKKHVEVVTMENGDVATRYQTGITGNDIDIDGRMAVIRQIDLVSEKSILEAEKAKQEESRKEYEREETLRKERYLLREEQKKKEKVISNECIAYILDKLELSGDEFKRERSSTGWIKDQKSIEKYTSEKVNGKAFRISMKIKGSNEKKVYLFDSNAILIFESKND